MIKVNQGLLLPEKQKIQTFISVTKYDKNLGYCIQDENKTLTDGVKKAEQLRTLGHAEKP